MVKRPPAVQETWVQSLGREDPLEKGMTTHSSILAWRIPWTEGPGVLPVHGVAKSQTGLSHLHFVSLCKLLVELTHAHRCGFNLQTQYTRIDILSPELFFDFYNFLALGYTT